MLTSTLGIFIALVWFNEVLVNIGGVVTVMSTCGTLLAYVRLVFSDQLCPRI
jgi:hypothetical protein